MKRVIAILLTLALALSLAACSSGGEDEVSTEPSNVPESMTPTASPSPSAPESAEPSETPEPSEEPTEEPSAEPSEEPSVEPSETPSIEASPVPTKTPSAEPTKAPTAEPSTAPTPTPATSAEPSATPEPPAEPETSEEPLPSAPPIAGWVKPGGMGGGESSESPEPSEEVVLPELEKNADVKDFVEAVYNSYESPASMDFDDDIISDWYHIDPSLLEEYAGKFPLMNVHATEIFVAHVKSDNVESVNEGIEGRLDYLKEQWSTYLVDQYELVQKYEIVKKGDYILFVINEHAADIADYFRATYE